MRVTNLRLIWHAVSMPRINITIGWNCVTGIQSRMAASVSSENFKFSRNLNSKHRLSSFLRNPTITFQHTYSSDWNGMKNAERKLPFPIYPSFGMVQFWNTISEWLIFEQFLLENKKISWIWVFNVFYLVENIVDLGW